MKEVGKGGFGSLGKSSPDRGGITKKPLKAEQHREWSGRSRVSKEKHDRSRDLRSRKGLHHLF